MRIISGICRGRKLTQIRGRDIRPTSDRVREALFNIIGPSIRGMRVLDLFAGTGAFGLEALSRGAAYAVFVDQAKASCEVIRKNIGLCRMEENAMVLCHDLVNKALPESLYQTAPFDLVFLDPPYRKGYAEKVLTAHRFPGLLTPDAWVVVEQDHKESLELTGIGLDIYRQKKYSKTFISILKPSAKDDHDEPRP